jgi:CheY-like chemotaxis protein
VLSGLNVLVVEDHEDSREALSRFISARGAQVFAAENGQCALGIACATAPDIILCDLTMPVMDGYQFVREFRARDHGRHIPVLALSALSAESALADADRAGFDGYLSKPLDLAVLVARIVGIRAEVRRAAAVARDARAHADAARDRALVANEDVVARMLRARSRLGK